MKKYKHYSKSQIDSMSDSERYEYYKNAVEHYGNLPNQLKGFKAKILFRPLLLLIARAFPVKIIQLNSIDWPKDNSPVIFSTNHSNANDFPVLLRTIHKHCFTLADFNMINDSASCLANRMNGSIFVDRKSEKSGANAFNQCVEGLKKGYSMIIFPESTWNLTKSLPMLPRYWGDVRIAQETGRPIIPVIKVYCGKICLIKFGECIYVSKDDSVVEKDKEVYNAMVKLIDEIKNTKAYKDNYTPLDYTEWLRMTLGNYKYSDLSHEVSCIRDDGNLPQEELKEIIRVGEEIRPIKAIREDLKYATINYRYDE